MAGGSDGSKPKSFACPGSFVNGRCAELDVNISVFNHEHFCRGEDHCIVSVTVLAYTHERYVQIGDAMSFGSG